MPISQKQRRQDQLPPLTANGAETVRDRPLRVMSIFGTRPEIIKFAPVIRELSGTPDLVPINVCTSQHTDLAAPLLDFFGIETHHDLGIMRPGQPLNALAGRMLVALDQILTEADPDFVLVQGDTTSAFAGAMAAFQRRIPVGHIEAGLRSGNKDSPFPEEINRRLISQVATLHFAACTQNRTTLLAEGVAYDNIVVTGNPVIDTLSGILNTGTPGNDAIQLLQDVSGTRPILMTAHRRENLDGRLQGYFRVLREFIAANPGHSLIFPVHPNPTVRAAADEILGGRERVHLIDPLPYQDFVHLLSSAWLLVSDSGGVQEEAPSLGKPLLVMRENTERPEAVDCGVARLVGEDPAALESHLAQAVDDERWFAHCRNVRNPFGDGKASGRISKAISSLVVAR